MLQKTRAFAARVRRRVGQRRHDAPSGPRVTEADVRAAYRLLLGREPDPDGWHNFGAMIGNAETSDLVTAFLSSAEFRHTPMHRAVERRERDDLELVGIGDELRILVSPHDLLNAGLLRSGSYERHLADALDRSLAPGTSYCAVGANIGFHTVRAAQRIGATGRAFAFEAHPQNAQLAARNLALNGLRNTLVLPFAVSDRREVHRYVAAQGTNGWIEPLPADAGPDDLRAAVLVHSVRLDDLIGLLAPIDVLQLDVEGCEGRVFRGATRLLAEHRPTVFTELCPGQLARTSSMTAEGSLAPLQRLGYRFTVLAFDGTEVPFENAADQLCAYASEQPTAHIDIRCDP